MRVEFCGDTSSISSLYKRGDWCNLSTAEPRGADIRPENAMRTGYHQKGSFPSFSVGSMCISVRNFRNFIRNQLRNTKWNPVPDPSRSISSLLYSVLIFPGCITHSQPRVICWPSRDRKECKLLPSIANWLCRLHKTGHLLIVLRGSLSKHSSN